MEGYLKLVLDISQKIDGKEVLEFNIQYKN
jgi:hypothetical protein